MCALRFKDRERVFTTGRTAHQTLGDLAQNDIPLREIDILLEFVKVDDLINQLQNYKLIIIQEIEQTF